MKTSFISCIFLSVMALACSPKTAKTAKADKFYDAPSNPNDLSSSALMAYIGGGWMEVQVLNAFKYKGNVSLWEIMSRNLKYPAEARESGIEGKVVSEVIINELGVVESVKVVKGIGYGCDQAAVEAIKYAAAVGFEPALFNGKPVKYKVFVPLQFYLTR